MQAIPGLDAPGGAQADKKRQEMLCGVRMISVRVRSVSFIIQKFAKGMIGDGIHQPVVEGFGILMAHLHVWIQYISGLIVNGSKKCCASKQ